MSLPAGNFEIYPLNNPAMASLARVTAPQRVLEDPLAYLPCSGILTYKKGQSIYSPDQPSSRIYLVVEGKVKVSRMADNGHRVILDIYQTDEFFGESAILSLAVRSEQATASESTRLMSWTTLEIEDMVAKRPRLAVALLQILVQRTVEFGRRIEGFSVDKVARRLASSLIRFGDRFGTTEENGTVSMAPLTHEMLSQYVGTTREVVTHYMKDFRRLGYVHYSRQGITLHRDAFREWLLQG